MSRLVRLSPRANSNKRAAVRRQQSTQPLAVLEFESPSAAIIARSVPRLSRATNLFVFLLVVSVLIASGLIRIDKVVSANGKLISDAPNIVIQPFDQTIVESIEVRAGDTVRRGQVLARLNATFTEADHIAIKDQVDLLGARAARLQAERDGTQYLTDPTNPHAVLQSSIFDQRSGEYESTLQAYNNRIQQFETQIAGSHEQTAHIRERLGIAADIEGMRTKLMDQQLASRYDTLLATDARMGLAAALSGSESSARQAERMMGAELAERQTFIERWKGQISLDLEDTRARLVDAEQRFAKTNLHNQLVVLTAPRDAIVLSVANISVGSVVTSAEPLIQLVPLDAQLSVEADISGIDSGYVSVGDDVRIKFHTLPFLRFGTARGVVRTISADSFSPDTRPFGGGSTLPGGPNTLYYRAEITLDELALHNTPPGFRPMPGMPVTADVKVGTRTVLGFFIDRILPVAHDGLREP